MAKKRKLPAAFKAQQQKMKQGKIGNKKTSRKGGKKSGRKGK